MEHGGRLSLELTAQERAGIEGRALQGPPAAEAGARGQAGRSCDAPARVAERPARPGLRRLDLAVLAETPAELAPATVHVDHVVVDVGGLAERRMEPLPGTECLLERREAHVAVVIGAPAEPQPRHLQLDLEVRSRRDRPPRVMPCAVEGDPVPHGTGRLEPRRAAQRLAKQRRALVEADHQSSALPAPVAGTDVELFGRAGQQRRAFGEGPELAPPAVEHGVHGRVAQRIESSRRGPCAGASRPVAIAGEERREGVA